MVKILTDINFLMAKNTFTYFLFANLVLKDFCSMYLGTHTDSCTATDRYSVAICPWKRL